MSDLEDLPLIEPRMGRSHRASSRAGGASFRNALLSVMRRGGRSSDRKVGRARSRVAVSRPGQDARRVIVKAHFVRMTASGMKAAALHLKYIERDGVEKDGSKGHLYTADGPARAEAFEEPRAGERHQFRLVVSPEDAGELELTDYVRRLMGAVERDLDRKLEWAAVNHFDTGHPHAHLVVRGVDREGREVRLDRGYISQGLRWRAQELATEELGPRLAVDVQRAQAREVTQDRFTSLDRELERRVHDGEVTVPQGIGRGGADPSTIAARLQHLEGLRLAERVSPTSWKLAEGWQPALRDLGTRGDILKQIHAALSRDPAHYRVVREGDCMPTEAGAARVVSGRVASKGLSDELKGAFYAVVETPSGRAYHLALDPRTAESVRPGDIVSFATRPESPVRPVDRLIAAGARAHGGVYSLEPVAGGASSAPDRRLRELERLGLATPEGAGRWKVSPNLLESLAERHRDHPIRHRLLLRKEPLSLDAQVGHPGPVWLDHVPTDALAPYGFGADVKRAVDQRVEALRRLGVQPDDPNRSARLRELERRDLGREMAVRSGQVFLPSAPDGFRGRIRVGEPGSPAASYAVVSDGQSFVLLRATEALRAAQGTSVMIARDVQGRLLLRPAPERDIGR
jgi:type IV secretory pathway VirD2 relaxase